MPAGCGPFRRIFQSRLTGLYDAERQITVVPPRYRHLKLRPEKRLIEVNGPDGRPQYYDYKGRAYFTD